MPHVDRRDDYPAQPTGGPALPAPVLEFMFETNRAITDLALCGAAQRVTYAEFFAANSGPWEVDEHQQDRNESPMLCDTFRQ